MDEVGRPMWTRMVAQDGRMWASKMGRSGCPMWTGCGFPSLPITGRPSPPIIGYPQLRVHHGCPLLGCHFVGGIWSPIIGYPSAPNYWVPTSLRCGRDSWAPFLDARGSTRTGRPRHSSTRRPIGHIGANRFNAQVRSPISIKCHFTSVGSNFFLIKIFFRNICKSVNCTFHLHRSLLPRWRSRKWNGVH